MWRRIVFIVECLLFSASALFAIMWACTGDGSLEPWTIVPLIPAGAMEIWRRYRNSQEESTSKKLSPLIDLRTAIQTRPLKEVMPQVLVFAQQNMLPDLQQWAIFESGGYTLQNGRKEDDPFPDYRLCHGHWEEADGTPIAFSDSRYDQFNNWPIWQSVSELEAMADTGGTYTFTDPRRTAIFSQLELNGDFHHFVITAGTLKGVLSRIRNELIRRLSQL